MPHYMTEDDFKTELLLWILIGAFAPRGYIDPDSIHSSAHRYKRELERRGIELPIYWDLVTERSREVDNAATRATEYGILGMQYSSGQATILGYVGDFLKKPRDGNPTLSDEEIHLAKQAAKAAYEAWHRRRLNDDLGKETEPTEASK